MFHVKQAASAGFGLYVHWPFCAAKCPYCDFNSHVVASVDHDRWAAALIQELRAVAAVTDRSRLDTVFFGGGTPSLMAPATVEAILSEASRLWTVANDVEITLEANPTSSEASRFEAFRCAGVNRISVGLQALDNRSLRRLGRQHDVAEGLAAVTMARHVMDRCSFDVIYARQDQTIAEWAQELGTILDMGPDHLSLYQLTIEPGTVFGRRHAVGRLPGLPDDDRASDMYDATQEACLRAGLPRYEVSNHAVPGGECRHNLIYWRGGTYAAVGPGAHGRLELDGRRYATQTLSDPSAWLNAVETLGTGLEDRWQLERAEIADEYLIMALRLAEGLDLRKFNALAGVPIDPQRISDLVDEGLLIDRGTHIVCTDRGFLVLNRVIATLAR